MGISSHARAIMIGAVVVSLTGWYVIDPLLGIGISVLIFMWAFGLMRDSINILMETSPKGINATVVTEEIKKNIPEVLAINDMHIWEITSGMYSLTAHIEATINRCGDVTEIIRRINKILNDKFGIEHTTIQIEPKNVEFP